MASSESTTQCGYGLPFCLEITHVEKVAKLHTFLNIFQTLAWRATALFFNNNAAIPSGETPKPATKRPSFSTCVRSSADLGNASDPTTILDSQSGALSEASPTPVVWETLQSLIPNSNREDKWPRVQEGFWVIPSCKHLRESG